jgi:dephospho-CoA kinase
MSDFQITDEDIDAVERYLEIYHPENANREYAQRMLESTKSALHQIAINNPDDIEALYEQLKRADEEEYK